MHLYNYATNSFNNKKKRVKVKVMQKIQGRQIALLAAVHVLTMIANKGKLFIMLVDLVSILINIFRII